MGGAHRPDSAWMWRFMKEPRATYHVSQQDKGPRRMADKSGPYASDVNCSCYTHKNGNLSVLVLVSQGGCNYRILGSLANRDFFFFSLIAWRPEV